MLKNLGMMETKNWGALHLQIQLELKYINKCPRELSCTAMRPWTVQLLKFECVSSIHM